MSVFSNMLGSMLTRFTQCLAKNVEYTVDESVSSETFTNSTWPTNGFTHSKNVCKLSNDIAIVRFCRIISFNLSNKLFVFTYLGWIIDLEIEVKIVKLFHYARETILPQ